MGSLIRSIAIDYRFHQLITSGWSAKPLFAEESSIPQFCMIIISRFLGVRFTFNMSLQFYVWITALLAEK